MPMRKTAISSMGNLYSVSERAKYLSITAPAIRLYDENGVLVNTFYPRSWLKYEYRVPVKQHRFYLEVGDRFGFLNVDTGGYLNFHYLFKVQRAGS